MKKNTIKDIVLSAATIDKILYGDYKYRSNIIQIMFITIKSLLPSLNKEGVIVDYKRYEKELELLKYYIKGRDETIENYFHFKNIRYWNAEDKTSKGRIIPIVVANTNFNIIKDEIIKNTLYFTGKIPVLLENIILSKILYLIIENESIEKNKLINELKEDIITLSQKEFKENYIDYYKDSIDNYDGNYKLDFERYKIELINLLNGIESNEYFILKKSINIIFGDNLNIKEDIDDILLLSILGVYNDDISKLQYKDKEYIERLADYLIKIRKGRIDPEVLKVNLSNIPDVFNYNEGDVFNHPLLSKSKILKKIKEDNRTYILLKTKSGKYVFKK